MSLSSVQTLQPSVNTRAAALVRDLAADAAELRIAVTVGDLGETQIDAGGRQIGGLAAGLRVAEICMGGLGEVRLVPEASTPRWPWSIAVRSSHPVIACLASQYAGWNLSHGKGKDAFFALGSGPARALARKEALFDDLGYADTATQAVLILESDRPPPTAVVEKVAHDCGLAAAQLTFVHASTQSLAGSCQVVARVLEVALHKIHELKFPLARVVDGMGVAPLPPPHPAFVTAMGRTNDAIIYGGRVQIFVSGPAGDAEELAKQLPSRTSRDYGKPFAEIFKACKGDFYAIDGKLFSPAEAIVTALETGQSFRNGGIDLALLDASFDG